MNLIELSNLYHVMTQSIIRLKKVLHGSTMSQHSFDIIQKEINGLG